jgi:AcrR family transcriptional regulator
MGRPSTAVISRERAAKAALGVIDVLGLDGFSLEAVAKRLGVKAPSLYHHFSNKNALLAEVARLLLVDVVVPSPVPGEDDREWFVQLSVAVRRSILRHPNAAALLLQHFPRHLLLSTYEKSLSRLDLPAELHLIAMDGMDTLTYGSALFAASSRAQAIERTPDFDPAEFPKLALAVRHNPYDDEAQFAAMIRAFLQGLAQSSPGHRGVRSRKAGRNKSKSSS